MYNGLRSIVGILDAEEVRKAALENVIFIHSKVLKVHNLSVRIELLGVSCFILFFSLAKTSCGGL